MLCSNLEQTGDKLTLLLADYCLGDVLLSREVFYRMNFAKMP